ncbi:MAG: phosphoribosylanthranilate isomerase [Gammaproteobacteria bacterium]|nr:phosphoribosylanthranilate isomerase [Gammaproteobacteria bacterium]
MPRTRVKICGITRPEDALAAAEAGADAIGLVFYSRSPRAVTPEQAQAIISRLPPFVAKVALFVDADEHYIQQVVSQLAIDIIQFHGDECSADCGNYGRPYIKAVAMRDGVDVAAYASTYNDSSGLLLDTYHADVKGGSGESFNWERFPGDVDTPLILAGGLEANNVFDAIQATRPYAVDVSSGVEVEKGIKDHDKIKHFIEEVRRADAK